MLIGSSPKYGDFKGGFYKGRPRSERLCDVSSMDSIFLTNSDVIIIIALQFFECPTHFENAEIRQCPTFKSVHKDIPIPDILIAICLKFYDTNTEYRFG